MPSSHVEVIFSEREVSELSKLRRLPVYLCILGILLGLGDVLSQPCLFVKAGGQRVAVVPAAPGTSFTIHFIHSVQKTPVWENLAVAPDGSSFVLHSTRYQSFGVGLPFLEQEGNFRQEGDYYIMDDMERHFPRLTLRTGVGTKLTLTLGGRRYRLYESYPPGTPVELFVSPLGKGMLS